MRSATPSSVQRSGSQTAPRPPTTGHHAPDDAIDPSVATVGPGRAPFSDPPLARTDRVIRLDQLDRDQVRSCQKCRLGQTRTQTVFGVGDPEAGIFFIGEGPGENEDLRGEPFVGRAGELLTKMIRAMGLAREKVYIANIVKCRPPNNRAPMPDETAACTPYLEQQLELIRPRVIVTLGLPATQYMLQTREPMSRLRGRWHAWRGIDLMPTYHPAYVLRQYTHETRQAVWSDLQLVMQRIGLKMPQKTDDSAS
jgi:DNA polymerase